MPVIRKRLNVVELYAGTGRSVQPFRKWQRARIAALIDVDPHAFNTYRSNFEHAPYYICNLGSIGRESVACLAGGRVDILLGCPPCQGFSDVGRRNSRDKRNSHLANFGRLAAQLRPLAIGMENVPMAASPNRFRHFTASIEKAGYSWTAGIINAALRGSAQCRQRLVFIAIRNDVKVQPVLPLAGFGGSKDRYFCYGTGTYRKIASDPISMLGEAPAARRVRKSLPFVETEFGPGSIPTVGEVLEGLPALGTSAAKRLQHVPWHHDKPTLKRMALVSEGGRWKGGEDHFAQAYGRLHRRGLARTVTTFFPNAGGGRFWHPTENRSLTLREAARLQGFPDSFSFNEPLSRSAVLVGNALDGTVARTIYGVIKEALS